MQNGWNRPGQKRCYRQGSTAPIIGAVLIAAGLILLFLCIPGWAWAALAGILLIAAGFVFIYAGKNGR